MTTYISEMEPVKRQKCGQCKMNMTLEKFTKKRDDTYQKTCDECLEKRNVSRVKRKCPHDRDRNECRECNGVSFCAHDRLRIKCIECGGVSMCSHNIQRYTCKLCSDPIKITIRNMISNSKQSDKKHDRYDPVNLVDYCFLENLLEDYSHCCYPDCNVALQIMERTDDMATIERLDNSTGHIKSNCVICCLKCNNMRKSDR